MELEQVVSLAYGPYHDAQQQRRAEDCLGAYLRQPGLFSELLAAMQAGLHTLSPEMAFWCCRALCRLIAQPPLPDPQQLGLLAQACIAWMAVVPVRPATPPVPPHVLNGFAQVMAVLYQHLEPSGWPAFWAEVARCCLAPNTAAGKDLFLRILEAIDEYAASSAATVLGDAQHHLSIRRQMLAGSCVVQVLAGLGALLRVEAEPDATLSAKALRVLQKYACWVEAPVLLAAEGLVDSVWRCAFLLPTTLEACDCLAEVFSRLAAPPVALLASLHTFDRLPQLVGCALGWAAAGAAGEGLDDEWLAQEYGVKVAYAAACAGHQMLQCAAPAEARDALVAAHLPWLVSLGRFDLRDHGHERSVVRALLAALLRACPERVAPLLQSQLSDALQRGTVGPLVAALDVLHGLGKGGAAERMRDPGSVHRLLLQQVLQAQPWLHPDGDVAGAAFRALARYGPGLAGEGEAALLAVVEALLGPAGVLHPGSPERRARAAKTFRKLGPSLRGPLLPLLPRLSAACAAAAPLGGDAPRPLFLTLGGLLLEPALPADVAAQCLAAMGAHCTQALHAALAAADIPQQCRYIEALTAFSQGLLGSHELPHTATAPLLVFTEAVFLVCQRSGHAAAVRDAAVGFLLALVPVVSPEPLAPLVQAVVGCLLPSTGPAELAGCLRLVEQLLTTVPTLALEDMAGTLFPLLFERVLHLTRWDLLCPSLLPPGVAPVLSDEGRTQAELQGALLTLLLTVQWKGYGHVLVAHADPLCLARHVVACAAAALQPDLARRALEVLAELLEVLSEVAGFQEFALCTVIPSSVEAVFRPPAPDAGGPPPLLLLAAAKLHLWALACVGPPVADAVRSALLQRGVPVALAAQCVQCLQSDPTPSVYRDALRLIPTAAPPLTAGTLNH